MKTKTNRILTVLLFTVCIGLLALLVLIVPKGANMASAATTPKYAVAFDYSATYTYGTGGGASQYPRSGQGVYSASYTWGANRSNYTVSVFMYG